MKRALILNVDDHELNRYLRAQYLSAANLDVIEARTGSEALKATIEHQPDLVLLDIHMPDMDGIEVCRQIKTNPRTQSTMVLQISASAVEISDAVKGLEKGADGYLIEPIEGELLVAHVRSLLRLRESEAALRRVNDRLQQFANLAGHDLQEPLRGVLIFSSLLERDAGDQLSDANQQHLARLIRSASKLKTLLDDLLVYSRASTLGDADWRDFPIENCVRRAISIYESEIQDGSAEITYGELPVVVGDETGITQVLQNLIGNSMKYRKPGQKCVNIRIDACSRGREVLVSVRDDGQGFPQTSAEHIFGIFKRLHHDDVEGSGIGLAVCRAIVEQHGGTMWAEGSEGHGSTFYFSLPDAGGYGANRPSDAATRRQQNVR